MGLLSGLKSLAPAVGGILGGAIGGPAGAAIGGGIGRVVGGSGGSRGSGRSGQPIRQGPNNMPGPRLPGRGGSRGSGRSSAIAPAVQEEREFDFGAGGGGINLPGGFGLDLPSFNFGSRTSGPSNGGSGDMPAMTGGGGLAGGFQGALGAKMLEKSVRSKSGRAILEAMQSGALQGGMIQQTVTVQTPRGTEQHSPPGFRTVRVNGQPFAVFKPLAQALRLLPKRSRAVVTAADKKAITKADRLTKKMKKLAQQTGRLKVTNK